MNVAQLTRVVRFAAAHRYFRPDWSEAENRERFGACSNPYGHGHNYTLEVRVQGAIDATTGFSVDLARIDEVLQREVLAPLDHQHINHAIDAFGPGQLVPTCENILLWLWPRIAQAMPQGATLLRLRLREDESLYVDYAGPTE